MYKNNFSMRITHVNQMKNKFTHMVKKNLPVYNPGDPVG